LIDSGEHFMPQSTLYRLLDPSRSYWMMTALAVFFLTAYLLGADFGMFQPDYFQAHSLTMAHLHRGGDFLQLLRTIPNSASGVFPLWLYGFVDQGFAVHKAMSLCVFIAVLAVIWRITRLDEYGRYFVMALLVSPMMISATAWVLPEMFSLLAVLLVFALSSSYPLLAVALSPLVPLSRQTFIVLLGGRLFFWPKNLAAYVGMGALAAVALAALVYVWGGPVPPNLAKVHVTPSVKSPIVALLIFSLYFLYQNLRGLRAAPLNVSRLAISGVVAVALVWVGLQQPPLLGGGYIFSRLEARSLLLAGAFEAALLTLFFYRTRINTVVFFALAALSFATTNFMFLKYVDFYFFAFLGYALSDIDERLKPLFTDYARSGFAFQLFSICAAIVFYVL
jgi:hypothetical protein